jgi:hypothetical protein
MQNLADSHLGALSRQKTVLVQDEGNFACVLSLVGIAEQVYLVNSCEAAVAIARDSQGRIKLVGFNSIELAALGKKIDLFVVHDADWLSANAKITTLVFRDCFAATARLYCPTPTIMPLSEFAMAAS